MQFPVIHQRAKKQNLLYRMFEAPIEETGGWQQAAAQKL